MPESRQASAARSEPPAGATPAKSEPDPLIGRTINGRFKIISVIARGGMGKVYKAEQAPLGRLCALKVLSPKYEGDRDPEFHKRFFLEASTAAKLTHPNTVTIFDYGQDGEDLYYIAMEFIEGKTLHRILREEGSLVESRVAHIASQICRSLREAHNLGVVHRDLKPGNILVSDRGDERDNVKVLDFGLVKDVTGEAEDLTQAGLFMGSPKYMAPEQILGGEITPRTDIYSLGVMMYEMLAGKVPFDRGASVGTLMAHVNDAPPPIRQVNPKASLSTTMDGIVARCLEKDPAKRFASMKDLLNALKRVGNEDGTLTDTHESMPMARIDVTGGVLSPDSMPSGPLMPGAMGGPESSRANKPVFASPSISDMLSPGPAPPADTDAGTVEPQPKKGKGAIIGAVVAVAVAIGVIVLMSSSKPPAQGDGKANAGPGPTTTAPADTGTAPAQTVAAPPTGAQTAPAPSAQARTIKVDSDPTGASVSEGSTELCASTPCEITWKDDAAKASEHKLSFNKKGYNTKKITIGASDDKASPKLDLTPVFVPRPQQNNGGGDKPKPKPSPYGD